MYIIRVEREEHPKEKNITYFHLHFIHNKKIPSMTPSQLLLITFNFKQPITLRRTTGEKGARRDMSQKSPLEVPSIKNEEKRYKQNKKE